MPTIRMTEISIRALKPTDAYVTYWSDQLPGFGLRVGRRTRTWTVMRGRERERVSIGRYPDMSLAEARGEAKRLMVGQPEPKALRLTFAEARDRFLQEHYRDLAASTKQQASLILKRHFKVLDPRQLVDLDDKDISRALDKLADRSSAQLHAYRVVRCFLSWCTKPPRRFIPRSPMEGYAPPGRDRKGTRILKDDELVAVWKASEGGSRALFRLLILWGTRNTETCLLEPTWRSGDVLTIPGEVTKNGRDHGIPLLPLAESVLASCLTENGYYFPGRWGEGHLSSTSLNDVRDAIQRPRVLRTGRSGTFAERSGATWPGSGFFATYAKCSSTTRLRFSTKSTTGMIA